MRHWYIVSLVVGIGITQLYADDSNTAPKKEDIKAVVLYQGKEVYDSYLKQKKDDRFSSYKEGSSSENNMSNAAKVHSVLKTETR